MKGSPSSPYPASTPAIAFLYLATIVTVEEDGIWKPAHEVARTRGTLHIITAWNPGDERPTREENDRANAALHAPRIDDCEYAICRNRALIGFAHTTSLLFISVSLSVHASSAGSWIGIWKL
jgi:hypothetical protein